MSARRLLSQEIIVVESANRYDYRERNLVVTTANRSDYLGKREWEVVKSEKSLKSKMRR